MLVLLINSDILKNVDLPDPDGPITATTSPVLIVVEIFFNTVLFPNTLLISLALITLS